MSMKIYNGFILADKYNDGKISTLNKWCRIVKKYTKILFNKKYICNFKKWTYMNKLNNLYNNNIVEEKNLRKAFNKDMQMPLICIYFYENKVYGAIFNDEIKLYKKLLKLNLITDFSYWDNCDKNENISQKNWGYREEVWNAFESWDLIFKFDEYLMYSNFYLSPLQINVIKKYHQKQINAYNKQFMYNKLYYILYEKYNSPKLLLSDIDDKINNEINIILSNNYDGPYLSEKEKLLSIIAKIKN